MENNHVTKLEIDLEAVDSNLQFFKSKLKPSTKLLVVVKAFGYGISAALLSKHLAKKVDYFAVAYTNEGIALRNAGITTPILVLHPQQTNFQKIIEHNLEPNLYSKKVLNSFISIAKNNNLKNYPIHLKFNTGLNRLGFEFKNINTIAPLLNSNSIKVASIFSHIAASEDLNEKKFTLKQINRFNEISEKIVETLGYTPMKHILNTSGILNYSNEAQFDMVRLGIGLYGFGNDKKQTENLKNVLQVKSIISQIHTINKGDTVGYNRAFTANTTIKTATIPIGHADGISRQLGNGIGYIYINNQIAPIIGNVCMDMIMVNVTNINCNEGDEVIVYKNQQHIEDLASKSHTIPYEILTAISQRVQRVLKKC
ncbi:alanine racemase [Lutibacter oricola]|uniref:Alanine racemase n=1 Tax=Lutibacter oricola TaxID=762486 RepID=A0A1H3G5B1_9FLAO|nr:alanine racemase [Lutibacter oricola]SDX98227.1 alanine racemase [Lutibacter oricola]